MNAKRLFLALCFALVCSGLLTWQLSKHLPRGHATERAERTRAMVVAAKDIGEGDELSSTSLKSVVVPTLQPWTGSFQNLAELTGRVVRVSINAGEPILAHDLAPANAGSGLAVAIPLGLRAVSVHALEEFGVGSGFVVPGSCVDLFVTYRSGVSDTFVTSLVLQDVRVLAGGRNKEVGGEDKLRSDGAIILLLSPNEVARLMAASSLGKMTFALRNGADRATTAGLTQIQFNGAPASEPKQASLPPARKGGNPAKRRLTTEFRVETLAGGKSSVQTFEGEQ